MLGIGQIEFKKIISLNHEIVLRLFESFVEKTSGEQIFTNNELVKLKPNSIHSTNELSKLHFDKEFKSLLEDKYFYKKDEKFYCRKD